VKRKRDNWQQSLPGLDLEKLVFLDESGINTAMARRYGRCPPSKRLVDSVPAGAWQSNTLLAAVRLDGVVAPMVLDGPVNGEVFASYIELSWCRRWNLATSSSWIICQPTRVCV